MIKREMLLEAAKALNEEGTLWEAAKKLNWTERYLKSIRYNYLIRKNGLWEPITYLKGNKDPNTPALYAEVFTPGGWIWTFNALTDVAECLNSGYTIAEIAERHRRSNPSIHGTKSKYLKETNGTWVLKPYSEQATDVKNEMRRLRKQGQLKLWPGVPEPPELAKARDDDPEPIATPPEASENQKIALTIDDALITLTMDIKSATDEIEEVNKEIEKINELKDRRLHLNMKLEELENQKAALMRMVGSNGP